MKTNIPATFLQELVLSGVLPEKRLLASILSTAITDFMEMKNKEARILEVDTGFWNEIDGKHDVDASKKGNSKRREDRNLIRWFRSNSKEFLSFLYIIEALDMAHLKKDIFELIGGQAKEV